MLVLEREVHEEIVVGHADRPTTLARPLVIKIIRARNGKVSLAFDAGDGVPINRREIFESKFGTVLQGRSFVGRTRRRKRARSA